MMWTVLWLVALVAVLTFSFVIAFGAPFLPTLKERQKDALELLDLKPGQTLVELGSGDGRILRAVAEHGVTAIGYELNPLLVLWTIIKHWKYRHLITVHWGNYWRHKLPETDAIYVFLLNPYMAKLDKKITQEITHKVKLVSFAFAIPGREPIKEQGGMMLYGYKPRLHRNP